MNDQSQMFDLATLTDSPNAISSLDSVDGPVQLDLLAGLTIAPYGRDRVPAKEKAELVSASEKTIRATSGRHGSRLSKPAAPLSLWESRLRERLALIGSTECHLTWKASTTPCGRPLSRLVQSMRPISEIDFGLYATPTVRDAQSVKKCTRGAGSKAAGQEIIQPLCVMAAENAPIIVALYPTPSVACATGGQTSRSGNRKGEMLLGGLARSGSLEQTGKAVGLNPAFVSWLMGYPEEWVNCAPSAMRSSRKLQQK